MKRNRNVHKRVNIVHKVKKTSGISFSLLGVLKNHSNALMVSLLRIFRTPFSSFMAVIVMAIALSLAGSFYVLMKNSQQLIGGFETGQKISLFLHEHVSNRQAEHFAQNMLEYNDIDRVSFISKEHGLIEFKQYSGFGDALDALVNNPLPAVIQIFPKETVKSDLALTTLIAYLETQKEVDFAQIDMGWVSRLRAIIDVIDRFVWLLSGLLALAVGLITANTIRLELQTRSDEVIVQKLIGATNSFIRLPFLYSGFWFCFISGILAWVIINSMLLLIKVPVEKLSWLYQSHFELQFMGVLDSFFLIFGASLLGILGAFIIINYQLKLLKPE